MLLFFRKFTFKKPGGSLSLQKSMPPSALLSTSSNVQQKELPKFGNSKISTSKNYAQPVSDVNTFNISNKQTIDPFLVDSDDDTDVLFLSQTKPIKQRNAALVKSSKPKKV